MVKGGCRGQAGDRDGQPWGVLQDSDGDNVAVVDDGGAVVAEFVYDPYGAVIGQRTDGVHPPLKAGHRGLFAESLTVGTVGTPDADLGDPIETASAWVDGRVLVPNERVLYHMRNRVYDPGPAGATAGRFIQRDPNASGAVLYGGGGVGGLGSHGAAGGARVAPPDVLAHLMDGVNTYGYLAGRMRGAGDPSGLSTEQLWRETRDGAMFLYNVYNTATAATDVGGLLGAMVESLTQTYSNGLSADVDWAFDWSRDDDDHARHDTRWVEIALIAGATRHWGMDYWDEQAEAEDDGPAMARSGQRPRGALRGTNAGLYGHLVFTGKIGRGRDFTEQQRAAIIMENRRRNGGRLICDVTGVEMTTERGKWNSVEIDHIVPKRKNGKADGSNSYRNAQAVIRQYNRRKGNNWIGNNERQRQDCDQLHTQFVSEGVRVRENRVC
jgi:hypothetical protein